jgi:uncharacterized protein YaaW (UPF0174 family)
MTLMAMVALAGRVLAHEGHEHKVLGKVVTIDEKSITVEGLDAKKVTGMLNAETKYMRDKTALTRADVKVGERVVVLIVEEHEMQMVKQVLLGAGTAQEIKK